MPSKHKKETFPNALGLKLQEEQQEKLEWTNSHKHTMKVGWFGVRKVDGLLDHPQWYQNASAIVNMIDGSDGSKNMKVKVQIWDPQMGAF